MNLIGVGAQVESSGEGQNARLDVLDGFFTLAAHRNADLQVGSVKTLNW